MNLHLVERFECVAHAETKSWDPDWVGQGRLALPISQEGVAGGSMQIYDFRSLVPYYGTGSPPSYAYEARPMRIDQFLFSGPRCSVVCSRNNMILMRHDSTSWYPGNFDSPVMYSIHTPANRTWNRWNPSMWNMCKCLSTSRIINGAMFIGLQDDNKVIRARWRNSWTDIRFSTSRVEITLPAGKRAGSLCIIPNTGIMLIPIVTMSAVGLIRSSDNQVNVYRWRGPADWILIDEIDVSGICEVGSDGVTNCVYLGGRVYLFEQGCDDAPVEKTPVQMLQCILE